MNKRPLIHFVLGPQGSGKTTHIRKEIDRKHPNRDMAVRNSVIGRIPYEKGHMMYWPLDDNDYAKHYEMSAEHMASLLNCLTGEGFGNNEPEDIYIEIQTTDKGLIDCAFALEYPGADCVFCAWNERALEYTVSSVF